MPEVEIEPAEVQDLSSDSMDEYVAPAPGEDDEEEDDNEDDNLLDISEEEAAKKPRERKGKKPKGTLRSQVGTAAEKFAAVAQGKRKVMKDSDA